MESIYKGKYIYIYLKNMNSIFIRTLLWNDPSDLCMLLYLYNAYVSRYEDRLRRMFDLRHKPDDLGIFLFFFSNFKAVESTFRWNYSCIRI